MCVSLTSYGKQFVRKKMYYNARKPIGLIFVGKKFDHLIARNFREIKRLQNSASILTQKYTYIYINTLGRMFYTLTQRYALTQRYD